MTATMPPQSGLRECRLYRFYVAHPVTGERVLGYVGETWQMPFDRLMQHVRDQPWADTMLGWELDPTVYWGKKAVLEAERLTVEREKPLYNYEFNLANPYRVEIWRAREQRWARDAANGKPRWVPPVKKPRVESTQVTAVRRQSITKSLTAKQIKACLWFGTWLVTSALTWAMLDRNAAGGFWVKTLFSLVLCGLLLVWSLAGAPVTKAQRRKVRRRRQRRKKRLDLTWIIRW